MNYLNSQSRRNPSHSNPDLITKEQKWFADNTLAAASEKTG